MQRPSHAWSYSCGRNINGQSLVLPPTSSSSPALCCSSLCNSIHLAPLLSRGGRGAGLLRLHTNKTARQPSRINPASLSPLWLETFYEQELSAPVRLKQREEACFMHCCIAVYWTPLSANCMYTPKGHISDLSLSHLVMWYIWWIFI